MLLVDRHLADGVLRRLYDDPLALSTHQRRHYADCAACRSRFVLIADDARATAHYMSFSIQAPTVDTAAALARVRLCSAGETEVSAKLWLSAII